MSKRARVIWSEGMLLSPHHMQLQDAYHEQRSSDLHRSGLTFSYGFSKLTLDREAVEAGHVRVQSAAGVFPRGEPFNVPEREDAPEGRTLEEHFPLQETELKVSLGLRVHRAGQAQIAKSDGGETRYRESVLKTSDVTTGVNEREVQVARATPRILFADENLGDYDLLPMARILRKPEGGYAYKEAFLPPLISIESSAHLTRQLQKLLDILVARSTTLSERRHRSAGGASEFGRTDVAGFWLLGVVNGFIPLLTHYLRFPKSHPETVFLGLVDLAGRLTTLSDEGPRDLPAYDHDNAGPVFADLVQRIPAYLEESIPQNFMRIPLNRRDELVFVGRFEDDRLLDPSVKWYLGASANVSADLIQNQLPDKIKIASPDKIDFLVSMALTGVGLTLAHTQPAALPAQAGFVYFQLDTSGDVWGLVTGSRGIAMYVPRDFPGAHLELIAILGD